MSQKITVEGAMLMMDVFFGGVAVPGDFTLELITAPTNLNPAEGNDGTGSTIDLFSGMNYSAKVLDGAENAAAPDTDGVAMITWDDQVFTFTATGYPVASGEIVGYVVLCGTTVVLEELFDEPYLPTVDGDKLTVKLSHKHGNGSPTVL